MMMCTAAPFALPAGLDGRAALSMCGYVDVYDDAAEMDALLGDINFAVHAHEGLTPEPSALPMPSAEFLALHRRHDNDLEAFLRGGIRSVKVAATTTGFAPLAVTRDDGPTTPVAELRAPFSYGDDDFCPCTGFKAIKMESKKRPEPSEAYDGDIDATFRKMEKDPAERPLGDYLWTTQEGKMTMLDRAKLVTWMYEFSRFRDLPPGALHRAVSYVDRFLSAKKIRGDPRLLGAVAAFAAAKYDDCKTSWTRINADTIARDIGCTRRDVVDLERDLVAALGYRLSGPTAYTFVEHFTRRDQDGTAMRSLAHHLANMTLLDYRCVPLLPSAVAAAAILVARRIVDSATSTCFATPPPQEEELLSEEMIKTTGYTVEDLTDIVDWVYEMHELTGVWPGCAQMMATCAYSYCLPPR